MKLSALAKNDKPAPVAALLQKMGYQAKCVRAHGQGGGWKMEIETSEEELQDLLFDLKFAQENA